MTDPIARTVKTERQRAESGPFGIAVFSASFEVLAAARALACPAEAMIPFLVVKAGRPVLFCSAGKNARRMCLADRPLLMYGNET